jgi:hypothetical protein
VEPIEAVRAWRRLANGVVVTWGGNQRTWAQHIAGNGYADEEQLVQPIAFRRFAEELLGFTMGVNLAPELLRDGVKPDFTPADAVTHPFVFETKSTNLGRDLAAPEQVERYLRDGAPRIRRVVLTNLVGLRVFDLDATGPRLILDVNLRGLIDGHEDTVSTTGDARRLAQFLDEYRRKVLTRDEKVLGIRQAPAWNPLFETTSPDWLSARLDAVVQVLSRDVADRIATGALEDPVALAPEERSQILDELRELEWRLASEERAARTSLGEYLAAPADSDPGLALRQYAAHVAYFAATRLMLVRIWEDLGLLEPHLYDGGFDTWMGRLDGVLADVVSQSYRQAMRRYPSLFDRRNNYTWFEPSPGAYVDVIYELANTYLGAIEADVLGTVYANLLERVDRKLLGQYYTPRDVVHAMWQLVNIDRLADLAERDAHSPLVIDIATGSGGFLVDAARRLRERFEGQIAAGANLSPSAWAARVAASLVGMEIQRFPAYLAEVNLLIQIAVLRTTGEPVRIPPLSILATDSLSTHNPEGLGLIDPEPPAEHGANTVDLARRQTYLNVKDPTREGAYWADVAIGNPPYVGEKKAAALLRRTRGAYPYWDRFVAPHLDYLYWFLILGVSKLRQGGRFAFITTEYWLRSEGGGPLREYLSQRCSIERILLFRELRLFPDAPGQHSMIIVGERVVPPDLEEQTGLPRPSLPRVSIYRGPANGPRPEVIAALRDGRNAVQVETFQSRSSPNILGRGSWAEVTLTADQLARRARVAAMAGPLSLHMAEGMISGVDRLNARDERFLTAATLAALGGTGSRAGIFVLTSAELARMGTLSEAEVARVRPIINTADVYPYAALQDSAAASLLYMDAPERVAGTPIEALHEAAFPAGYPRLQAHLTQFRSLLVEKVRSYGERRPWWSIHRPRREILANEGLHERWGNYALTTRWGAGGRLLIGLAPRGTVPASGLHAIWPDPPATAAYVVGLVNSTYVQGLADGLAPGTVRQRDLVALRLPLLPETAATQIATNALALADLVAAMITVDGSRFPSLPISVRENITLATPPLGAWLPEVGPETAWGLLPRLGWVTDIERAGPQAEPIDSATVEHGIFGLAVVAQNRNRRGVLRIRLASQDTELANALRDCVLGLAATRMTLRDIERIQAPVDPGALAIRLAADRAACMTRIEDYRRLRNEVDNLVAELL